MLLKDAKGRKAGSAYARLFGNTALGHLISRVQAAVISSGNELERMILKEMESSGRTIDDLDDFLQQEIMSDGVLIAPKSQVKKCKTLDFAGAEPDYIIFRRREGRQQCHIVELKDGDTFDTKKAAAEHRTIHSFISANAQRLQYTVQAHFCCFNQDSKEEIVRGFKEKIPLEEAMTGKELCDLLELDYQRIVREREKNAPENLKYFLSELVKIEPVRKLLKRLIG